MQHGLTAAKMHSRAMAGKLSDSALHDSTGAGSCLCSTCHASASRLLTEYAGRRQDFGHLRHHRSQVVGVDQLHQRAEAQQLETRLEGVQGQADALQFPQQGHHALQGAQGPCTPHRQEGVGVTPIDLEVRPRLVQQRP